MLISRNPSWTRAGSLQAAHVGTPAKFMEMFPPQVNKRDYHAGLRSNRIIKSMSVFLILLVTDGCGTPCWDSLVPPNYLESFITKKNIYIDVSSRGTLKVTGTWRVIARTVVQGRKQEALFLVPGLDGDLLQCSCSSRPAALITETGPFFRILYA